MQTLVWLAKEVPWVMVPATLISVTATVAIIASLIRSSTIASKAMVIGAMVALTIGVMLWDVMP